MIKLHPFWFLTSQYCIFSPLLQPSPCSSFSPLGWSVAMRVTVLALRFRLLSSSSWPVNCWNRGCRQHCWTAYAWNRDVRKTLLPTVCWNSRPWTLWDSKIENMIWWHVNMHMHTLSLTMNVLRWPSLLRMKFLSPTHFVIPCPSWGI